MGTTERRAREKQELREKILEAARELFAERGYEAVTMRAIAQRIEYSATAIYHHFADKTALLKELCRQDFLALASTVGEIAGTPDPVERLERLGQAYAEFAFSHPNHYRLMFMTPGLPEEEIDAGLQGEIEKGNPDQDAYALLFMTVSEAIAAGRLRAELTDAHLVAQVAWSTIHGVVSLEIAKGCDRWVEWRPVLERARLVGKIVTRGLVRPGDPLLEA